jgi:hypothetical protein
VSKPTVSLGSAKHRPNVIGKFGTNTSENTSVLVNDDGLQDRPPNWAQTAKHPVRDSQRRSRLYSNSLYGYLAEITSCNSAFRNRQRFGAIVMADQPLNMTASMLHFIANEPVGATEETDL